jgi:hypothetical protein
MDPTGNPDGVTYALHYLSASQSRGLRQTIPPTIGIVAIVYM